MPKFEGINRNYASGTGDEKSDAEKKEEREKLMKEFLAKGGKVEKVPYNPSKIALKTWKF
jgi:hypothetical protein